MTSQIIGSMIANYIRLSTETDFSIMHKRLAFCQDSLCRVYAKRYEYLCAAKDYAKSLGLKDAEGLVSGKIEALGEENSQIAYPPLSKPSQSISLEERMSQIASRVSELLGKESYNFFADYFHGYMALIYRSMACDNVAAKKDNAWLLKLTNLSLAIMKAETDLQVQWNKFVSIIDIEPRRES